MAAVREFMVTPPGSQMYAVLLAVLVMGAAGIGLSLAQPGALSEDNMVVLAAGLVPAIAFAAVLVSVLPRRPLPATQLHAGLLSFDRPFPRAGPAGALGARLGSEP